MRRCSAALGFPTARAHGQKRQSTGALQNASATSDALHFFTTPALARRTWYGKHDVSLAFWSAVVLRRFGFGDTARAHDQKRQSTGALQDAAAISQLFRNSGEEC